MVSADAWLVGVVWADSDGVEWMDKSDFARTFDDDL